jgi:hypothetical protein
VIFMQCAPRRAILTGSGVLGASVLVPSAATAGRPAEELMLLETYMAGTGYHDAPKAAPRLCVGDPVLLRRRPDNRYDPRTVEVRTVDGALLGHVPRIDNQALARLMDAGIAASAKVTDIAAVVPKPAIRFEVAVALG